MYGQKGPKALVRIIGQAPLAATVYSLEWLRCGACGQVFTAQEPEGVGPKKYDETAAMMLAGVYQNSTGSTVAGFGSWSAGPNSPLPAVTPKPFSTSLGTATTINYLDPQKNGEAPHYQAWSLSLQRQLPWNMLITLAYSANRVTHLTGSNINPISQPDPSVLQYGSLLTSNINSPGLPIGHLRD